MSTVLMYGEDMRIGMLVAMGSLVLTGAFAAPFDPEMLFRDQKVVGDANPEFESYVKPSESADWELSYSAEGMAVYKTLEGKLLEFPINIPRSKEPIRLAVSALGTMLDIRGHITVHGTWRASRNPSDHAILKVSSYTSTRGMTRNVEGGSDLHHKWLGSGTEIIAAGSRNTQVDSEFKSKFSLPIRFHYRSTQHEKNQDDLLTIEHHLHAAPSDEVLKIELEPNRFFSRVVDGKGRSAVAPLMPRISEVTELVVSKASPSDQYFKGKVVFTARSQTNEPARLFTIDIPEGFELKETGRIPGEYALEYSIHSLSLEAEMKSSQGEAVRAVRLNARFWNSEAFGQISLRFKSRSTLIVDPTPQTIFQRTSDVKNWERISVGLIANGGNEQGFWINQTDHLLMKGRDIDSIRSSFPTRDGIIIWETGPQKAIDTEPLGITKLDFVSPFDRPVVISFYSSLLCTEQKAARLIYGPTGFVGEEKVYFRRFNDPDLSRPGLKDLMVQPAYHMRAKFKDDVIEKDIVGPLPYWKPKSEIFRAMTRLPDEVYAKSAKEAAKASSRL